MKKITKIICIITCFYLPTNTICHSDTTRNVVFGITVTSICAASIYGLTRIFSKPKKFKPTKKNLHIHVFAPASSTNHKQQKSNVITFDEMVETIHRGKRFKEADLMVTSQDKKNKVVTIHRSLKVLKKYNTFFIASRGYAKSNVPVLGDYLELTRDAGAAIEGHMLIKDNLVHDAPCITFDYPDDPHYFNFGQNLDVSCLKTVWNYATRKKDNPSIIAIGDCRGGKALLNFATTRPTQLKAMILMSPFISDKDLIDQIAKNHIKWLPWSNHILFNFFKFYFPSFDPNQDDLIGKIHKIDPELPIFIGHRKNDFLVSDTSMRRLLHELKKAGNKDLYLLVVSDDNATHSRISPILDLQYAANAFLAAYELPHNPQLAQKGQLLLEQAKFTAQNY
ncbi:MAG TPA: hypothetical protein VJ201_06325 [Candidatus Babeliales bacterium]|nr:hypothetical protein [Candidatus Babeliales bacterium]